MNENTLTVEELETLISTREEILGDHRESWVNAENAGNWVSAEEWRETIKNAELYIGKLNTRLAFLLKAENTGLKAEIDFLRRRANPQHFTGPTSSTQHEMRHRHTIE